MRPAQRRVTSAEAGTEGACSAVSWASREGGTPKKGNPWGGCTCSAARVRVSECAQAPLLRTSSVGCFGTNSLHRHPVTVLGGAGREHDAAGERQMPPPQCSAPDAAPKMLPAQCGRATNTGDCSAPSLHPLHATSPAGGPALAAPPPRPQLRPLPRQLLMLLQPPLRPSPPSLLPRRSCRCAAVGMMAGRRQCLPSARRPGCPDAAHVTDAAGVALVWPAALPVGVARVRARGLLLWAGWRDADGHWVQQRHASGERHVERAVPGWHTFAFVLVLLYLVKELLRVAPYLHGCLGGHMLCGRPTVNMLRCRERAEVWACLQSCATPCRTVSGLPGTSRARPGSIVPVAW
jgi:hypothetical protein